MYQNGSLLASMSDSGDSTPSNLLHTSQLGHQGYINGSKPFDAQYAGQLSCHQYGCGDCPEHDLHTCSKLTS